jgi:hypothetical protein
MSNIGDYQALVAALSVEFTSQAGSSVALTATDAVDLKNSVQASATPIRLLLPWGGGQNITAEMLEPDASFGPNVPIRWTFSDFLLWRPIAFGEGLGDATYDLREYASAYMTAALTLNASSISDRMTFDNCRVQVMENINFPVGSNTGWYIGAVATWTVTEDDPPKE